MSAALFPVVEYETPPGYQPIHGPISVDLRWVANAQPARVSLPDGTEIEVTLISMCGSGGYGFQIMCDYADFMRDWMRARG